MSIRPVLLAVTRPCAESTDLSGSEDHTQRARVSGGYRIAATSLEWLRFMQQDEFPANMILGNSGLKQEHSCYPLPLASSARYTSVIRVPLVAVLVPRK